MGAPRGQLRPVNGAVDLNRFGLDRFGAGGFHLRQFRPDRVGDRGGLIGGAGLGAFGFRGLAFGQFGADIRDRFGAVGVERRLLGHGRRLGRLRRGVVLLGRLALGRLGERRSGLGWLRCGVVLLDRVRSGRLGGRRCGLGRVWGCFFLFGWVGLGGLGERVLRSRCGPEWAFRGGCRAGRFWGCVSGLDRVGVGWRRVFGFGSRLGSWGGWVYFDWLGRVGGFAGQWGGIAGVGRVCVGCTERGVRADGAQLGGQIGRAW
jgi:hypothetical protein